MLRVSSNEDIERGNCVALANCQSSKLWISSNGNDERLALASSESLEFFCLDKLELVVDLRDPKTRSGPYRCKRVFASAIES